MSERERLEQAIAQLEAQRSSLGDTVVEAAVGALRQQLAALEAPPAASEQRKQVTVLFADVSGFTALSETMDAEDLSALMNALWSRLDQVIVEHGGHIDKHMGDALMALWGTMAVREDDPERAIRAALAMQSEVRAVAEAHGPAHLQMRIGINTGLAHLGAVGTVGEYTAIGEAVNLTSRLQTAAPLGGVLISHDTYRHVRGLFEVQPLAPLVVRGKAEPIQVYIVLQAKQRAFRLGTRGVEGVETRMVGRETELRQLREAFQSVLAGQRQAVTILGEAGVGKSRLLYEFEKWAELLPQHIRYFKGRASPEMQSLPYALLRDLLVFRFAIRDSDPARVMREKMEQGVGEIMGQEEPARMKAHIMGQWLGFDFRDSPFLQGLLRPDGTGDAQQLRDRAQVYLREFFHAAARHLPTVIFVEDVHWADDSSLDALVRLAQGLPDQRLFLVFLTRPALYERRPTWGEDLVPHTRLELRPLSKEDSRQLVGEILQKVPQLPDALRELIVGGAEGNPFYLEELIKMLLEDGVIVKSAESWRVEPARLTTVRVPPTLTGVIQARLDSLTLEERAVLQRAAVVGRLFWDSAVARISAAVREVVGEDQVSPNLTTLQGKEMVFHREASAFADAQEYIFKHALLREVTYESVLKRVRRVYHGLVADWLIERSRERLGEYAGLIAEHLELAGRPQQALGYLYQAGAQAAAQFANAEAVRYLTHALDLVPETDLANRYRFLLARERVYDVQGAREVQFQDLAALEQLAATQREEHWPAEVALRQANYAWATGDLPAGIAAAERAIALTQDAGTQSVGHYLLGRLLWNRGDYAEGQVELEQAVALARAAGVVTVEADSLRNLGNVAYFQRQDTAAAGCYEQALQLARAIGDRRGESATLNSLGLLRRRQGDIAGARTAYEQALAISQEIGYRYIEAMIARNLGGLYRDNGDFLVARPYLELARQIRQEIGDRDGEGEALLHLGWLCQAQGDYAAAERHLAEARQIFDRLGRMSNQAWALGSLGELWQAQGHFDRARVCFEQALPLYQAAGYAEGEIWIHTLMGLLWYEMGQHGSAQACCDRARQRAEGSDERGEQNRTLLALGLLAHRYGEDEVALGHFQQALQVARELHSHSLEEVALMGLGHALLGLGRPDEAAAAYREELALGCEFNRFSAIVTGQAGLARAALALGNSAQALASVEDLLGRLQARPLTGAMEPFSIYLTCYHVLRNSQDLRANQVLKDAYRLLQAQAAEIEDAAVRRSFLEEVPANRDIVRLCRVE